MPIDKSLLSSFQDMNSVSQNTKPRFCASDVASLLGRNQFKSKNETILKILTSMPKYSKIISNIKKKTGLKTEKEIIKEISPEIKSILKISIDTAVISKKDKDIEVTIKTFKKELVTKIIEETLNGFRKSDTREINEAIIRIKKGETIVKDECSSLSINNEIITAIEKTNEHKVLVSEIQKQRGIRLENIVEDNYEIKTGSIISERNSYTQFDCDDYKLIGYLDGMINDKVMETKNRKRYWVEPPEYDIIQLRCYMFMKGKLDGILFENFPDHESRNTNILWNDEEWDDIHDSLCEIASYINNISLIEVEELAYYIVH
jgi:hypothetical protein